MSNIQSPRSTIDLAFLCCRGNIRQPQVSAQQSKRLSEIFAKVMPRYPDLAGHEVEGMVRITAMVKLAAR